MESRRIVLIVLMLQLAPATAFAESPFLYDRWIQRLESMWKAGRMSGRFSASQQERLEMSLRIIRAKRDEALEDGIFTVRERRDLRDLIREANMDLAEARFGPIEVEEPPPILIAGEERDRSGQQRPRTAPGNGEEAGSHTIVGAH